MNLSSPYILGIILSLFLLCIVLIPICIHYHSHIKIEFLSMKITSIVLCIVAIVLCGIRINNIYQEVYYLEYTVYYPGNTCKYKVDSCNQVYVSSDRGTNHIRYYSIPGKDNYGTDTTAPIVIDKIIKK